MKPQLGDRPSSAQAAAPELVGGFSAAADYALNVLPPGSRAAESQLDSHG